MNLEDVEHIDFKAYAVEKKEAILKYFSFAHLPAPGRDMSKAFAELAVCIAEIAPPSAERAAGLRKLLEAKDCAVRSVLP